MVERRPSIMFSDRQGTLKRIDVGGGPAQTVARIDGDVLGRGIDAGRHGDLRRAEGRDARPGWRRRSGASGRHGRSGLLLDVLPDGRHFLYTRSARAGERAVYVGDVTASPDQQSIRPAQRRPRRHLHAGEDSPTGGYLLIPRDGALLAQPFDADTRELSGTLRPVAENVFAVNNQVGFGGRVLRRVTGRHAGLPQRHHRRTAGAPARLVHARRPAGEDLRRAGTLRPGEAVA